MSCGNAYDRDQRPVVVGRGWILAVISLTETNEIAPIAEALGAEAHDRCGEAR